MWIRSFSSKPNVDKTKVNNLVELFTTLTKKKPDKLETFLFHPPPLSQLLTLSSKAYFPWKNQIILNTLLRSPPSKKLKIIYITKCKFPNSYSLYPFLYKMLFSVFLPLNFKLIQDVGHIRYTPYWIGLTEWFRILSIISVLRWLAQDNIISWHI